jgi:hypothetical protein
MCTSAKKCLGCASARKLKLGRKNTLFGLDTQITIPDLRIYLENYDRQKKIVGSFFAKHKILHEGVKTVTV